MPASQKIKIGFVGLSPIEINVLKSVSTISCQSARKVGYEVVPDPEQAGVVVLDAGTQQVRHLLQQRAPEAILWVGTQALDDLRTLPNLLLARPLLASRLLAALDKLVEPLLQHWSTSAPTELQNTAAGSPEPKASVLVVDDSPTVRKQLELILTALNVQVHCVSTGEDVAGALTRCTVDLVLLDVVLPGEDGYTVCRAIKRNRATRHTPVVMLTSKASPFDKIRGSLSGCESYLTKPVAKDEFERTVLRYLRTKPRPAPVDSTLATAISI